MAELPLSVRFVSDVIPDGQEEGTEEVRLLKPKFNERRLPSVDHSTGRGPRKAFDERSIEVNVVTAERDEGNGPERSKEEMSSAGK